MLRSSEIAAEAERRSKAVLEAQASLLQADLHAKQAGLAAVQGEPCVYTKIYAPEDGAVGERQVRPGQHRLARYASDLFCRPYQMGASELSRNPVGQHEGWRSCRTSDRRLSQ